MELEDRSGRTGGKELGVLVITTQNRVGLYEKLKQITLEMVVLFSSLTPLQVCMCVCVRAGTRVWLCAEDKASEKSQCIIKDDANTYEDHHLHSRWGNRAFKFISACSNEEKQSQGSVYLAPVPEQKQSLTILSWGKDSPLGAGWLAKPLPVTMLSVSCSALGCPAEPNGKINSHDKTKGPARAVSNHGWKANALLWPFVPCL